MTGNAPRVYYFLGNITSHVLHALPLWGKLGGTFIVTSNKAKDELSKYSVPAVCIDDIPYVWKRVGRRPQRVKEYTVIDKRFKKTTSYLNNNADIVLFYELFDFSDSIDLQPKCVFLTHGNMIKNYFKMYPKRLEIIKHYDYMAALGPYMKEEFIESGIPPEKLVDIGVARTDELVNLRAKVKIGNNLRSLGIDLDKPIVSYLPTFWSDSSVAVLGPKLVSSISDDYTVLVRVHPQTPKKIQQKYESIANEYPHIYFVPELGPSNVSLLDLYAASSVIIGDTSSVMLEALLLDKPLVFADTDTKNDVETHHQLDPIVEYAAQINSLNVDQVDRIIADAIDKGTDNKLWNSVKSTCFYDSEGTSVRSISRFIKKIS